MGSSRPDPPNIARCDTGASRKRESFAMTEDAVSLWIPASVVMTRIHVPSVNGLDSAVASLPGASFRSPVCCLFRIEHR